MLRACYVEVFEYLYVLRACYVEVFCHLYVLRVCYVEVLGSPVCVTGLLRGGIRVTCMCYGLVTWRYWSHVYVLRACYVAVLESPVCVTSLLRGDFGVTCMCYGLVTWRCFVTCMCFGLVTRRYWGHLYVLRVCYVEVVESPVCVTCLLRGGSGVTFMCY